jgi:hypothetical protein
VHGKNKSPFPRQDYTGEESKTFSLPGLHGIPQHYAGVVPEAPRHGYVAKKQIFITEFLMD